MITIYTKNNCPYCVQAKNLMISRSIPFTEVNIEQDIEAREFILSQGHRSVPQLYHENRLFVEGGFQGLSKMSAQEIHKSLNLTDNLGTL